MLSQRSNGLFLDKGTDSLPGKMPLKGGGRFAAPCRVRRHGAAMLSQRSNGLFLDKGTDSLPGKMPLKGGGRFAAPCRVRRHGAAMLSQRSNGALSHNGVRVCGIFRLSALRSLAQDSFCPPASLTRTTPTGSFRSRCRVFIRFYFVDFQLITKFSLA